MALQQMQQAAMMEFLRGIRDNRITASASEAVDVCCFREHELPKSTRIMTQDERWLAKYKDVRAFIETNHRNPFKYYDGEKLMVHFLKWSRKPMNAGELKEDRITMFRNYWD